MGSTCFAKIFWRSLWRSAATRRRLLANAKALAASEERAMKEALEREFENEIKDARLRHQRRVQECLAAVKTKWHNLQDQVQTFFATQAAAVADSVKYVSATDGEALNEKLQRLGDSRRRIFDVDSMLKLGILAEALAADKLKEAVRKVVATNITTISGQHQWTCDLIKTSLAKDVLVQLPIETVLELSKSPRCAIVPAALDYEINMRRKVFRDQLCTADNETLQRLVDERVCPFDDVVEQALAQRGNSRAFGRLCLDESLLPLYTKLETDIMTVSTTHVHRYATVHASHGVVSGSWGRWFYEVKILSLDTAAGSTVSVGWDVPRSSLEHGPSIGLSPGSANDYGVALQSDGHVHRGGQGEFVGMGFKQGDVVGVGIDLQANTVLFYVNGHKVQRHASIATSGSADSKLGDFKTHSSNYHLLPACNLFSVRPARQSKIVFNFLGPFEKKPKGGGYEALGTQGQ